MVSNLQPCTRLLTLFVREYAQLESVQATLQGVGVLSEMLEGSPNATSPFGRSVLLCSLWKPYAVGKLKHNGPSSLDVPWSARDDPFVYSCDTWLNRIWRVAGVLRFDSPFYDGA